MAVSFSDGRRVPEIHMACTSLHVLNTVVRSLFNTILTVCVAMSMLVLFFGRLLLILLLVTLLLLLVLLLVVLVSVVVMLFLLIVTRLLVSLLVLFVNFVFFVLFRLAILLSRLAPWLYWSGLRDTLGDKI